MAEKRSTSNDDAILKQLKDRFRYASEQWREIREAGKQDLAYLTGDPWTAEDRQLRVGRPLIAADQLSQYTNQLINDVRQNPRAIKVSPRGAGATKKTADLRANKIREIEYRSHAQLVYTTMFSNTAQRGYGFMAVRRKWASERADLSAFNQELWLEPIVNPDLITPDPDALMPDGRDMRFCFEGEWMDLDAFKNKYPKAEVKDFTIDTQNTAPDWFREGGRKILVCNYWTIKHTDRRLLLLKPPPLDLATLPANQPVQPPAPIAIFEDELPDEARDSLTPDQILDERKVSQPQVCMYTSNGVEILDEEEWPGQYIPIIACYGKVEYVDAGSGAKRMLLSLVRLARDLQKGYNYLKSTEFELIGMTPKTPYVAWRGQVTQAQKNEVAKSLHQPVAVLEFEMEDAATGKQFPGLPERQQYNPAIEPLEIAAESTRRDIQAAIGSNPLPTQAQKRNEKSGVALKQIQDQEQRGSYHFVDHYEDAIRWGGVVLDDLLDKIYDAARDIAIREVNGTQKTIRINDPNDPGDDTEDYPRFDKGDHDIVISTGPSFDSEREQASDFADTLISSEAVIQIVGPEKAAKLLALAIRLKSVGPLGDQMADLIAPPEPEEGHAPDPAQMKVQLDAAMAQLQQLDALLKQEQLKNAINAAKQDADLQKTAMNAKKDITVQRMADATKIAIAKLQILASVVSEQARADADRAESEAKLAHDREEADFERQHDAAQSDVQHAQTMEQVNVAHQQAMESQAAAAQAKQQQEGA